MSERPRALVTGGARRVGRAIALGFARAGCDVDITYSQSEGEAAEAVTELGAAGSTSRAYRLPQDDLREVERVAEEIKALRTRWDVLVLNASMYRGAALGDVSAQALIEAYTVNAAAGALIAKVFAPSLTLSACTGGGSIVTMCDIHAMGETGRPRSGFLAYSMSKAALLEMTLVLARELAPRVRVNAVAPGVVAFPESGYESDAAAQEAYLKRVPLGRSGTPTDAAGAVVWLALQATYCTGQVIRVDGGRGIV